MTNVQFIIQYLSEYPDSRYTDITQALCAWKGKRWSRGHYSRYFTVKPGGGSYNSNTGKWYSPTIYPNNLWTKGPAGLWYLTKKGYSRVQPGNPTKLINFVQQ